MAWESDSTGASSAARSRQNSSAAGHNRALSLQQKTPPVETAAGADPSRAAQHTTHSSHVADPFLHAFLEPDFDPAAYWNRAFETASTAPAQQAPAQAPPAAAAAEGELARQAQAAQATLSQIGAHTARLTGVLTQLTDDILRSGGRLAYEVELLRGETIGLSEVVTAAAEEVAAETAMEAGAAKEGGEEKEEEGEGGPEEGAERKGEKETALANAAAAGSSSNTAPANPAPPSLAQLRMLAQVRSRLDAVIRTFGDAMEFVMPPSALSMTASFLSVSGPGQTGGDSSGGGGSSTNGAQNGGGTTTEEKGQQVLRARREEITRLLAAATGPTAAEIETATARVAALRTLCRVWVGTPEEKARVRFVEGLQRMVDDRVRDLERAAAREEERERERMREKGEESSSGTRQTGSGAGSGTPAQQDAGASGSRGYAAAGYGFISQLQKMRSGL